MMVMVAAAPGSRLTHSTHLHRHWKHSESGRISCCKSCQEAGTRTRCRSFGNKCRNGLVCTVVPV